MTDKKKKTNNEKKYPLNIILLTIIVLISLFNTVIITNMDNGISKLSAEQKELSRPADIEITKITTTLCDSCTTSVDALINEIKTKNVNILTEKTVDSTNAAELIVKYDIKKLPIVIITGELAKNNDVLSILEQTGTIKENTSYQSSVLNPPYYDITEKKVKGQITATLISDSTCSDCADIGKLIDNLEASGISITKRINLDYKSDAAKSIISVYDLKTVPTVILSSDADDYTTLKSSWSQLGTIEKDGAYVLRMTQPPFRNISTGNIDGRITLTYLVDNTCDTCYDVTIHKQILSGNFGVVISKEVTYDITSAEGLSLIEKYNLTNIPTVIISKDASAYTTIKTVWDQVGTIESDGNYVFRVIDALGQPYKNIKTGKMVGATPQ